MVLLASIRFADTQPPPPSQMVSCKILDSEELYNFKIMTHGDSGASPRLHELKLVQCIVRGGYSFHEYSSR